MYSEVAEILKGRTKQQALGTLLQLDGIPYSTVSNVLIKQLTKSSTCPKQKIILRQAQYPKTLKSYFDKFSFIKSKILK